MGCIGAIVAWRKLLVASIKWSMCSERKPTGEVRAVRSVGDAARALRVHQPASILSNSAITSFPLALQLLLLGSLGLPSVLWSAPVGFWCPLAFPLQTCRFCWPCSAGLCTTPLSGRVAIAQVAHTIHWAWCELPHSQSQKRGTGRHGTGQFLVQSPCFSVFQGECQRRFTKSPTSDPRIQTAPIRRCCSKIGMEAE